MVLVYEHLRKGWNGTNKSLLVQTATFVFCLLQQSVLKTGFRFRNKSVFCKSCPGFLTQQK